MSKSIKQKKFLSSSGANSLDKIYHSRSPAKINLYLDVLGLRKDGYHEIRTIYQSISLSDEIEFEPCKNEISLNCDDKRIPADETNLAFKSAKLLKDFSKAKKGVRIKLLKKIPSEAGLGGGSSNAAVTLFSLNKLWKLDLPLETLLLLASKIGSDVPFFLIGGTAIGIGRGEEVYPLKDISRKTILLIYPDEKVNTKEAYQKIDRVLTEGKSSFKISSIAFNLEAGFFRSEDMFNRFEEVVFESYERIKYLREEMVKCGLKGAMMSGSGSTLFAILRNKKEASSILKMLKNKSRWAIATTLNRKNYFEFITPTLKKEIVK